MTKQEAISKIKSKPSTYLNDDQKTVAIGIINSIPEGEDVLKYFDFIMKRSDVGFKFDVAPEIATGRIAVVNEMENLNINISEKIDVNENKLIIGDNYEALKNLLLTHKEKIDVIYIDPPYNTEKSKEDGNSSSKEGEHSKFVYKDKFGRNGWLNMMRERLVLARRLLTNEGVIFVSIDDTEQAYLKVLMDEIFGEQNFVTNLPRKLRNGGKNDSLFFRKNVDYVLVYTKNISALKMIPFKLNSTKYVKKDNYFKERGKYQTSSLDAKLTYSKVNDYPFEFEGEIYWPGGKNKYVDRQKNGANPSDYTWRWSKELMEFAKNNGFIEKSGNKIRSKVYFNCKINKNLDGYFIEEINRTFKPSQSYFTDSTKFSNQAGSDILKNLNLSFDRPKPTSLIKILTKLFTNRNDQSLVLDFFAGSATTGHAILELNREDCGNRKFILVTNNHKNIALDKAYKRLFRIIKGETIEGKKDFAWIKKNNPFNNASLRVFNIKHFDVETNQSKELDNITKFAIKNLHKLNPLYKIQSNDIRVYYDLDGLNPLNEAQKKQLYSTDKIIHEKSTKKLTFEKNYCTCGKSFNENDELIKHIKKLNN